MRDLPDTLDDRALALLEQIVPGGAFVPPPFRIWAQNIALAEYVEPLGRYCRHESTLSPDVREVAVLVCARHFRSPGAWHAHDRQARAAGLGEGELARLAAGEDPAPTSPERHLAWEFCRTVLGGDDVGDDLFARVTATFGADGLLDLLGCLGSFGMAAWALNVYRAGSDEPWPFPGLDPR